MNQGTVDPLDVRCAAYISSLEKVYNVYTEAGFM